MRHILIREMERKLGKGGYVSKGNDNDGASFSLTGYRYRLVGRDSGVFEMCPNCNRKSLRPFVEIRTGEILGGGYGRCVCGYFVRPFERWSKGLFVQRLESYDEGI